MWSLRPSTYRLRKLLGRPDPGLATVAVERIEIAPPESCRVPPVIMLPGQAERIRQTAFTPLEQVIGTLAGSPKEACGPTLGWRLRDVDVIDGIVYAGGTSIHLRARSRLPLPARVPDAGKGVLYESWIGNRWFGNWLGNDCLAYPLAVALGDPVTTRPAKIGHAARYESLLGMTPRRIADAHFDELVVIEDVINNSNRVARARDIRTKLVAGRNLVSHAGVFLLRGDSGDLRHMENEREFADRMAEVYGLQVVDPMTSTADDLLDACAGARMIVGIEGSHLIHGVVSMAPGGTVLTLQPADRVTTTMKLISDRWLHHYAMIVCQGRAAAAFRADWDDVIRTMDLIATETSA